MIRLHCTKKLSAKLNIDYDGFLPESSRPPMNSERREEEGVLSGWHANLITLQRRNCVIMVHDTTRFPVLITCLKKADFDNLNYWFSDAFMNTLLKTSASENHMQNAGNILEPLCIDTQCDRSVLGTMNQLRSELEHLLWYDNVNVEDLSPYRTAVWLAERPRKVKGQKDYLWPEEEMFALLDGYSAQRQETGIEEAVDNVIPLDSYRK
jgi:hypothetical protein